MSKETETWDKESVAAWERTARALLSGLDDLQGAVVGVLRTLGEESPAWGSFTTEQAAALQGLGDAHRRGLALYDAATRDLDGDGEEEEETVS
jgi:hypothetical protein